MFIRKHTAQIDSTVTLEFEGQKISASRNDTVSAALLSSGVGYTRTTEKGEKRAPYCQMGICFECLVEIDGQANQQACLTPVRDGMKIKRQAGRKNIP